LRVQQLALYRKLVGEAVVEQAAGCETRLVLRTFRVRARKSGAVETAFKTEFEAGLGLRCAAEARKQGQG